MKPEEVNQITDLSSRMARLKDRLSQLDAERAEVRREISSCMLALSSAMSTHFSGAPQNTTRARVLAVFHADPNLRLTAADLGPMVGEDLHATLRALLRRMVNEGLLVRVRRGLYALRR
jgi:hypothetical protein